MACRQHYRLLCLQNQSKPEAVELSIGTVYLNMCTGGSDGEPFRMLRLQREKHSSFCGPVIITVASLCVGKKTLPHACQEDASVENPSLGRSGNMPLFVAIAKVIVRAQIFNVIGTCFSKKSRDFTVPWVARKMKLCPTYEVNTLHWRIHTAHLHEARGKP